MILKLNTITKYYQHPVRDEKRMILNDLNLEVQEGESIAVLGPSGSGKSTLLNLISLLDQANSGQIFFEGKDLNQLKEQEIASYRNQNLGFIFQEHHLLPQLNALENVLLPLLSEKEKKKKKEAEIRAKKLLEEVGLGDVMYQYPSQLSGGECQRVAVVRALIREPKLLLADEPTGSLDQESAEKLGDLLVNINQQQKLSLIVVTHSKELAEKMQKVYRIEEGKLK
jgi:ABC-type lipoprotein export system ATPase subunit